MGWDGACGFNIFNVVCFVPLRTQQSTIHEHKACLCQASHRERHCAKHGSCPAHCCAGWWSQLAKQAGDPAIVRLLVDEAAS